MICRLSISIKGAVQGVGFRPFIYKLARELALKGFVLNNSSGVLIEAEGEEKKLKSFLFRIGKDKPPPSIITSFEHSFLDPIGYKQFIIKGSESHKDISAIILPDIAVCNDCLEEMWNPSNRRYRYPFINCTNCGPRFSIIESLPYDRPNISMKNFVMCEECKAEYEDPSNRRFHAQPIACPKCGPQISLLNRSGKQVSINDEALLQTIGKIKIGKIVAIKGLGGFQLVCDASNDEVINTLRKRKRRNVKPFALMFGSLSSVQNICFVSPTEKRVLLSPESPIVLLKLKSQKSKVKSLSLTGASKYGISPLVAPNNPCCGIMLPYTPLHHLLMGELKTPIVATSGNLSEEPICIDNQEAMLRLRGIADYFLVHNRPIVRHVDDSIVRVVMNREMIFRRARGYAPLPITISQSQTDQNILAVGGHLKSSIALKKGNQVFVSQHIGDLSTNESAKAFENVIGDFLKLYKIKPTQVIRDFHPDYYSTKYANKFYPYNHPIQHHTAHVSSCRLENQVDGDALGVSWDGTGYGKDGTVWGGEFFLSSNNSTKHIAQFRKFKLPGGEKAIQEPRRSLAGLLYEINSFDIMVLRKSFSSKDLAVLSSMLGNNYNSPNTSSVGRLFDAVSALLELCSISEFEGHAAMMLEFAADSNERGFYDFYLKKSEILIIDWEPMIGEIIKEKKNKIESSIISAKFHNTLALMVVKVAEHFNLKKVILSGGCFQNVYLLEKTINLLKRKNKKVYWHQRIPTNDGGISLGQIAQYLIQQSH